jgi:thiol-disulfide isomerase/thioredoxin
MFKKNVHISLPVVFIISAIILAATLTLQGCKKKPAEQAANEPSPPAPQPGQKINLNDVINAAHGWGPIFASWYGRPAPDFILTDINGKQHKLSDYHGRNVMITLWATWCGPCLAEIPHLIELRNTVSEDKLAMFAVSYITPMPPNTTDMVKKLAERRKINYTVFSIDADVMPAPYSQITGIPSSFFIDPQGKIKLAAEGLLSLNAIKAILEAE